MTGVLASFTTVTDAVLCAGAILQACRATQGLKLRIGIHLGDVVFKNNDVCGDGVNIASRLQALAPVGGIWVSESVHKNISNKKGISSRFIREETLKNVKEAVRIYELKIEDHEWINPGISGTSTAPSKNLPEKSIAVLPFVNMSNDPEQDYFSDGIAEEILNSLAHLKELKIKVAGRTSSFQFKGENIDLREVGEKLCVRNVLEGSVRKQGNRLRITAQLINVEDGYHLWSEKYDREMDDIFAIQDEIALAITEKLKVTLLEKDREIITRTHTQNSKAYELYLKGRFNINRRDRFILSGMQYFQEAMSIDPDFALLLPVMQTPVRWRPFIIFSGQRKSCPKQNKLPITLSGLIAHSASLTLHWDFIMHTMNRTLLKQRKIFVKQLNLTRLIQRDTSGTRCSTFPG